MTDMAVLAEELVRGDLARLLAAAVEQSGRARCDIARETGIHKDALRRILVGSRSATLAEALRILKPRRLRHMRICFCSSGPAASRRSAG